MVNKMGLFDLSSNRGSMFSLRPTTEHTVDISELLVKDDRIVKYELDTNSYFQSRLSIVRLGDRLFLLEHKYIPLLYVVDGSTVHLSYEIVHCAIEIVDCKVPDKDIDFEFLKGFTVSGCTIFCGGMDIGSIPRNLPALSKFISGTLVFRSLEMVELFVKEMNNEDYKELMEEADIHGLTERDLISSLLRTRWATQ